MNKAYSLIKLLLIFIITFFFSLSLHAISYDCNDTNEGLIVDLDIEKESVNFFTHYIKGNSSKLDTYLYSQGWQFGQFLKGRIKLINNSNISIDLYLNIDKIMNSFNKINIPNELEKSLNQRKNYLKRDYDKLPKSDLLLNSKKIGNFFIKINGGVTSSLTSELAEGSFEMNCVVKKNE